ncbi:MAG: replication-associated recombination protein A [Spirochaetota bacterium]|nr:replication-associated recombination protein A [Spirochaetota bacterium]
MSKERDIRPLAERCRPHSLDEFVGQKHLLGFGKIINVILEKNIPFSLIMWGDPGTGKTTLARLIAECCEMESYFISAISSGVVDVRKIIERGKENKKNGIQTLLFLDEIHRFNKAQQDAVLGAVEVGSIILIGATTENPSFQVIAPLLSRTRVLKLNKLSEEELLQILDNALDRDEILRDMNLVFEKGVKDKIVGFAQGDARLMLNILETSVLLSDNGRIIEETLMEAVRDQSIYYDRAGDRHYDTISAFIKSLRGSDPNASVYYLARMLISGEDPEFIARRMVIFASEDIGNAYPNAITIATSTLTAVKSIGMPESEIILSQCATFLATSPKSNAAFRAIKSAKAIAKEIDLDIPMHLRNAPTELMKDIGYAKGYKYPHDYEEHFVNEEYLPDKIRDKVFYDPTDEGSEKSMKLRLSRLWPEKYKC